MADERNFRSSYYEKVGFRSVEEKKSLEILLKDKPLDRVKLMHFCLRFTLPGMYRSLVWKVLLGVLPVHTESHKLVMKQREEQLDDLLRALKVIKLVTADTPKSHLFVAMWLLETKQLKFDLECQVDDINTKNLFYVTDALFKIFDDDVDVYWISKGFYNCIEKFRNGLPKLVEYTRTTLEKEDSALYRHLVHVRVIDEIPLETWFCRCFAGVIQESALERIWDKLVGGSCMILSFVAIVLLTTLRRLLLACNSTTNVLKCLHNITEETADVIATKAIEMWQHYGSPVVPGTGPDSMKNHVFPPRPKLYP